MEYSAEMTMPFSLGLAPSHSGEQTEVSCWLAKKTRCRNDVGGRCPREEHFPIHASITLNSEQSHRSVKAPIIKQRIANVIMALRASGGERRRHGRCRWREGGSEVVRQGPQRFAAVLPCRMRWQSARAISYLINTFRKC